MTEKHVNEIVDNLEARRTKYHAIASLLRKLYGYPVWRQHLEPVDELVNCILSQSTSDTNRDRAYDALIERFPTWDAVRDAPTADVIATIYPAGLANQKGPRIQEALKKICNERGEITLDFLDDLSIGDARDWLTSLRGVGLKTAAIVLCFAFNRPAFPVDTHVHRLSRRIGLIPEKMSAEKAHHAMEAIVPVDDYYAFHLNLIRHGREVCHARRPNCEQCPLQQHCDYYQQALRQ